MWCLLLNSWGTSSNAHFFSTSQLYLTDLQTRESVLLCTGEHPILQLALHDDSVWVASTDSSVHRWPAEGRNPQKIFQRGNSFLAGNLSFSRARVSLEGSTPVCYIYFSKVQHANFIILSTKCCIALWTHNADCICTCKGEAYLPSPFSASFLGYDGICLPKKFLFKFKCSFGSGALIISILLPPLQISVGFCI